jgi:gas vesicle protein
LFDRPNHLTTFLVGSAVGFATAVMMSNRRGKEALTVKAKENVTQVDNMVSKEILDDVKSVLMQDDQRFNERVTH